MSKTTTPRFGQSLEQLKQLASEAEVFYSWTKNTKRNQHFAILASAQDRMTDAHSRLLRSIAHTVNDGQQLFRMGIVSCFCKDEATVRLLYSHSATPYWYWRIVKAAVQDAVDLPLTQSDIWRGIQAVAAEVSVEGVGSGLALKRPIELCSPEQREKMHQEGVLIDDGEGQLKPNLLFA